MAASGRSANDRRVQKTQKHLHDALMSLIRDKRYDAIAVKEILERANVGRSTFYAHYRDKDDLLVSGIHDVLQSLQSKGPPASAKPSERLVRFSLPILEHIGQHRRAGGGADMAVMHAHLRHVIVDFIADDVTRHLRARKAGIPVELVIQYVASTFVVVLEWWLESRTERAPKDVDDVFRALILPTLSIDETI